MATEPTCAAVVRPGRHVQTIVAKVDGVSKATLTAFATATVVSGESAVAFVDTGAASPDPGLFLLVTFERPWTELSCVGKLKSMLLRLPGEGQSAPDVLYVRPLTRRLQRLFHWGDAHAKRADVEKACKAEDVDELLAILPQARRVIERENPVELALIPQLHDALQSPPALEDCQHEFFQEHHLAPTVRGPCPLAACSHKSHATPLTRCLKCKTLRCHPCARKLGEQQEEREDILDLYRECQKPPPPAFGAPEVVWLQHPTRPLPFYVLDWHKVPANEKLLWLRQELGKEVDLCDFAQKFLELFSESCRDKAAQKTAILQLYSRYKPECQWRKDSDIPPGLREEFQRIWNPEAPKRCKECAAALTGNCPITRDYCNEACAKARLIAVCSKCKQPPEVHNGWRWCPTCQRGGRPPNMDKHPKKKARVEHQVGPYLDIRQAQNYLFFNERPDPKHSPAWKRKLRS